MNKALSAALEYARCGLQVFPVMGKRPVTPNGMYNATTNEKVITDWWTDRPFWGVAIKIPDWAVVLDIDGDQGINALQEFGFKLPATLSCKSGKGKHHWYIRKRSGIPVRRIRFLPCVDILVNGYVVAPPSKHQAGGEYQWEETEKFNKEYIEIAPEWIETSIQFDSSQKDSINVDDFFEGLPEGERQTGLFRYACSLQRRRVKAIEAKVLVAELAKRSEGKTGYAKYPDTNSLVDRVYKRYAAADLQENKPQVIKVWSLADLHNASFPPTEYLIEKSIPSTGYTLLTSPPKRGKSLIAADAALSIALGKEFLGLKTTQSGVLYLDLEQSEEEALERWTRLVEGVGMGWPANLHTAFTWPSIDDGGLDQICEFLADNPHVSLVVIDTLADFWPEEEQGSSNAYHREQRIVRRFAPISRDYGCGFLVVHHDKKSASADMIQNASGTYALTGKAKAVWHLARETGTDNGMLQITGKNIPEQSIPIYLARELMRWKGISPLSEKRLQIGKKEVSGESI